MSDEELLGCWTERKSEVYQSFLEIEGSGHFRQIVIGPDFQTEQNGIWRRVVMNDASFVEFDGILLNYLTCSRIINQCEDIDVSRTDLWQWQPTSWLAMPEQKGIPPAWVLPVNHDEGTLYQKNSCLSVR